MQFLLDVRWTRGLLLPVLLVFAGPLAAADPPLRWQGNGAIRLVVRVDPVELGRRTADEMPAQVKIDFDQVFAQLQLDGSADLNSLQVMRIEPATGRAQPFSDYRYADSRFDRPLRWYDGEIADQFPEFEGDIRRFGGIIRRQAVLRRGHYLGTVGTWRRGHLAWVHNQAGGGAAYYAIYFDRLPPGQQPAAAPPRGWLGDGLPRCDRLGATSTGCDHCRIDLDDWNDDGLIDILLGENYGHLLWWPNTGSATAPKFSGARLVRDEDGLPLDAGMVCAPKVVDWDGDGVKDLLVGTERNRIMFFRNTGDERQRKLHYEGVLTAGGRPLELPVTPVANASQDVFKLDYYPVLETVDWDGDGDVDLLAGGGITGRIFLFAQTGRDRAGWPLLAAAVPLRANGKPLNVRHWFAAPCLADFDADGDLDLLTGRMLMGTPAEQEADRERALLYFENAGTPTSPRLREEPFPGTGTFARYMLATPRSYDWDADGDLDLVVSDRHNVYLFENKGTASRPQFAVDDHYLPSRWGAAPIAAQQFLDWNGDHRPDLFQASGYEIRLRSGAGNPWSWTERLPLLDPGTTIVHPSGIGDDWFRPYLDDFDGDGHVDILFGDWFGHVWLHRDEGQAGQRKFDRVGVQLRLASGQPIKVGPIGQDPDKSFDALQGARTDLAAADFDQDGVRDLVVSDTFGKVRCFRNAGTPAEPVFDEPVAVGDLGIRAKVAAADWDQDGRPDVLATAASGKALVFLNRSSRGRVSFEAGADLHLPAAILGPEVKVVDLNSDGDTDLVLSSNVGCCFVERSFLQHGYARGAIVRVERRGAAGK